MQINIYISPTSGKIEYRGRISFSIALVSSLFKFLPSFFFNSVIYCIYTRIINKKN